MSSESPHLLFAVWTQDIPGAVRLNLGVQIRISASAPRALGTWTAAKAQSSHSSNNEISRQQFPIWSQMEKTKIQGLEMT